MDATRKQRHRPRLDEEAGRLAIEGGRFLEASSGALAAALLSGDYDELVAAAQHGIRCNARALGFFSTAMHVDLERAA